VLRLSTEVGSAVGLAVSANKAQFRFPAVPSPASDTMSEPDRSPIATYARVPDELSAHVTGLNELTWDPTPCNDKKLGGPATSFVSGF
jgi:hypothetical protein